MLLVADHTAGGGDDVGAPAHAEDPHFRILSGEDMHVHDDNGQHPHAWVGAL